MSEATRCMKCGGSQEEGFLLEHGHYDMKRAGAWAPGKPEPSFWTGLKTDDKSVRKVRAVRCTACGLLELYA